MGIRAIIVGLGLLLGMSAPSYAFDLSAMGGVTLSNLNSASLISNSSSSGTSYCLGLHLGMNLAPTLSVVSGVFYMQHALSLTNAFSTGVTSTVNFNNLSLPVMLRFSPFVFFNLEAGGYFGLSSSANAVGMTGNLSSTPDSGVIVGSTLLYPLAPTFKLRLSAYYQMGFSNVLGSAFSGLNSRNVDIFLGIMLGG